MFSALALGLLICILTIAPLIQATVPTPVVTPDNLVLLNSDGSVTFTTIYAAEIGNSTVDGNVRITRLVVENRSTQPSSPVLGSVYFDTVLDTAEIYNGSYWIPLGGNTTFAMPDLTVYLLQNGTRALTADWDVGSYGIYGLTYLNATSLYVTNINGLTGSGVSITNFIIESGLTFPASPINKQVFYNTAVGYLYVYSGAAWTQIGTGAYDNLTGTPDLTVYLTKDGATALTNNWNLGGSYGIYGAAWVNATSFSGSGQLWWNGQNRTDTLAYPYAPYSYEVGVVGSNYYMKNGSDGQISWSTNASTIFNTLTAMANISVFVKEGIYFLDSTIMINGTGADRGFNIQILGAGFDSTIFQTVGSINAFNISNCATVKLSDFCIVLPETGTSGYGIYGKGNGALAFPAETSIYYSKFERINVYGGTAGKWLMYFENPSYSTFEDIILISWSGANGICLYSLTGANYFMGDCVFYGQLGISLMNNAIGFSLDADSGEGINLVTVSGRFYVGLNNNGTAIFMRRAQNNILQNIQFESASVGINCTNSGSNYFSGAPYVAATEDGTFFYCDTESAGNTFEKFALALPASSVIVNDKNTWSGRNIFRDISISYGTQTVVNYFVSTSRTENWYSTYYPLPANLWKQENWVSGTNTTATTIVLSHDLMTTPEFVFVSFSFTGWTSWTWTATTTQITITVTGTLPASYTAYAYAKYGP